MKTAALYITASIVVLACVLDLVARPAPALRWYYVYDYQVPTWGASMRWRGAGITVNWCDRGGLRALYIEPLELSARFAEPLAKIGTCA